ncbi:hypothetical protein [Microcoleus sp. MON2_D5]|uniref:hypothetical protein n=1 Tax=Microcoleus sp. MON2_D5 TaxID=2818833 RepID=UPI002FD4F98C
MNAIFQLDNAISKELTVEADGKAYVSRRGIARLCGVDEKAIRLVLERSSYQVGAELNPLEWVESITKQGFKGAELDLPNSLKPLVGQSFEGGALIPDTAATCIIEYYAFDAGRYCTEQARLVYRTFAAIGFRIWVQSELGWKPAPTSEMPLPTTHLELTVTLGQEMVKLERRVNEHSNAIAELKTTVTQLADAKVEKRIIEKEIPHISEPFSDNDLNPIVGVVEAVEATNKTKEQIRLEIERLRLETVKEKNRGIQLQIESKKKGVSKAVLKIVPPRYQTRILVMAERNGGEVTLREVQHTISAHYRPSSQAARECFKEVASLGYGTLTETGRSLKFHIGAEGRQLLESLHSDRAIN